MRSTACSSAGGSRCGTRAGQVSALADDRHLVLRYPALLIHFALASGDDRLADLIGRRLIGHVNDQDPPARRPGSVHSGLATQTFETLVQCLGLDRRAG